MSEFGELLKALRSEKSISQRRLAELVGIDFTYISKIENGTMAPPSEETIIRIAGVFNENPDKLIIAAKKVPTDFNEVIFKHKEIPRFLRKADNFSEDQWEQLRKLLNESDNE